MFIGRRKFAKRCVLLAGAAVTLPVVSSCQRPVPYSGPKILSARTESSRGHYVGAYTPAGETLFELPIAERAHGMVSNPVRPSEIIFFARRPGLQLHSVDIEDLQHIKTIEAETGRHFYGHGSFSADGSWLYTTENDYENGSGVVVVRDAQSLQVVDEFSSQGIGPHELHLMPDQKTIVVANGGILTHPDQPQKKLNIPEMQPSLVYLSARTGELLDEFRLPYPQLGIRHIDVSTDGRVAMATQIESEAELPFDEHSLPLIAMHQGETELQLFQPDAYPWHRFDNYCGSVTIAADEQHSGIGAVTSPRGGRIAIFDFAGQQLVAEFLVADICGVGYSTELQGFIATSGTGSIFLVDMAGSTPSIQKLFGQFGVHWDNHLLVT